MHRIKYVLPDPAPTVEPEERQRFMWREHQQALLIPKSSRRSLHGSHAHSINVAGMTNSAAVYLALTQNYETFEPYWLHLRKGDVVRLVSSRAGSEWIDVVTRDGHKARVPSTFCQLSSNDANVKKRKVSFDASMNVTIPPEPEEVITSSRHGSRATTSCSGGYSKLMRHIESKGRAVVQTLRRSYTPKKQTYREEGRKDGRETSSHYDRLGVYSTSTPALSTISITSTTEEFRKRYLGTVTVLYDFNAACEDEISVQAGQTVMLLNKEDADWVWVRRFDGEEGFVPANYTTKPVCTGEFVCVYTMSIDHPIRFHWIVQAVHNARMAVI